VHSSSPSIWGGPSVISCTGCSPSWPHYPCFFRLGPTLVRIGGNNGYCPRVHYMHFFPEINIVHVVVSQGVVDNSCRVYLNLVYEVCVYLQIVQENYSTGALVVLSSWPFGEVPWRWKPQHCYVRLKFHDILQLLLHSLRKNLGLYNCCYTQPSGASKKLVIQHSRWFVKSDWIFFLLFLVSIINLCEDVVFVKNIPTAGKECTCGGAKNIGGDTRSVWYGSCGEQSMKAQLQKHSCRRNKKYTVRFQFQSSTLFAWANGVRLIV